MKEKYQHKHSLFIFLSINCINEQIRGMLLKRVKMGKRVGRAFIGMVLGIALVVGHTDRSVIYSVAEPETAKQLTGTKAPVMNY